jgi:hypothetical protein
VSEALRAQTLPACLRCSARMHPRLLRRLDSLISAFTAEITIAAVENSGLRTVRPVLDLGQGVRVPRRRGPPVEVDKLFQELEKP